MPQFINQTLQNRKIYPKNIDIWRYPLNFDLIRAYSLLNKEERERANRFHFDLHKKRFIIAHAMLRLILSQYLNIHPSLLDFQNDAYGKPFLPSEPSLHFNLSHSADMALIGVGYEQPLGIDLEFFSARPFTGIAKHIFSDTEINHLSNISTGTLPLGFFHLWAQKEAMIKACGIGLSYPTKTFTLPLLPYKHHDLIDPKFQKKWRISSFMPQVACCAAVCYHPDIKTIHYYHANPLEWLS